VSATIAALLLMVARPIPVSMLPFAAAVLAWLGTRLQRHAS
jgi:hypothetical protein